MLLELYYPYDVEPAIFMFGLIAIMTLRTVLRAQHRRGRGAVPEQPAPRPNPRETLAAVQPGELVKLIGEVRLTSAAMVSALSGRPCVAYVACAKVWHSKKIPQLIEDVRDMKVIPFALDLPDGEVIVAGDAVLEWPTSKPEPRSIDRERAFLAERKLDRYLDSTEFEEAVVRSGDRISIVGVIAAELSGEHGYRDQPVRTRIVRHARLAVTIGRPRR